MLCTIHQYLLLSSQVQILTTAGASKTFQNRGAVLIWTSLELTASLDVCSKKYVYEQEDLFVSVVMSDVYIGSVNCQTMGGA